MQYDLTIRCETQEQFDELKEKLSNELQGSAYKVLKSDIQDVQATVNEIYNGMLKDKQDLMNYMETLTKGQMDFTLGIVNGDFQDSDDYLADANKVNKELYNKARNLLRRIRDEFDPEGDSDGSLDLVEVVLRQAGINTETLPNNLTDGALERVISYANAMIERAS